jgi:GT2 family glycosyltransferase
MDSGRACDRCWDLARAELTMLVSTIIATIARPTLERAVRSALDQGLGADFHEVIVVNDSGAPLDGAVWSDTPQVLVVETRGVDRCIARNTGAALSRGRYLHFLDDDDYLLPGGLGALLEVARGSDAVWVYGALQRVDDEGRLLSINRPEIRGNLFLDLVAGESLALGAALIDAQAFLRAGGFDPDFIVSQDRELACRLSLAGEFEGTEDPVAAIRVGPAGATTTNWSRAVELFRRGREKSLELPGALARLVDAAGDDPHLHGRAVRTLAASMLQNAAAGRLDTAFRRLAPLLCLAGAHPLRPEFWQGLRRRSGVDGDYRVRSRDRGARVRRLAG